MTLTDEEILTKAHRTATKYNHTNELRYSFADTHMLDFARAVIAAHDERLRQQNPPCMVANECSTKCDDCPDAAPIPPDDEWGRVPKEVETAWRKSLAVPIPPTGWQPIDTAPSMGKPVLVWDGKKILRAALVKKFELSEDDNGLFNDGEGSDYNEANDTIYWPEGWYEWNEYEEWRLQPEPTHWMPLPAQPEGEKK